MDGFALGDLFKCDKRGFYYMVGRVKDMIRRAGENIAALELETVLVGLQDVAEAAVVPVEDELRGEEVKAYIVPRAEVKGQHTLLLQVMEHCMRNLAPFKSAAIL
jgi:acyl-coenzyme A synthetase/AMP-(fatty) acid ligase